MTMLRILAIVAAAGAVASAADEPAKAPDPATLKDKVTIALGKAKNVQFRRQGDALSDPKVVAMATDDPPTLQLDFRKQGDMLILIAQNPYPKALRYRALARLEGRTDYFETSILPVFPKLAGIELWQDPIEELILFDFKLTDEKPQEGRSP